MFGMRKLAKVLLKFQGSKLDKLSKQSHKGSHKVNLHGTHLIQGKFKSVT